RLRRPPGRRRHHLPAGPRPRGRLHLLLTPAGASAAPPVLRGGGGTDRTPRTATERRPHGRHLHLRRHRLQELRPALPTLPGQPALPSVPALPGGPALRRRAAHLPALPRPLPLAPTPSAWGREGADRPHTPDTRRRSWRSAAAAP